MGRFRKLYVSLFGDPDSPGNRLIVSKSEQLAGLRSARYPMDLSFYDASSARIWG
jgi:hypothetical protein